jgi:hypothetical protein
LQFDGMLTSGLIPLRIVGKVGDRHTELMGYKGDHRFRRLLDRSHAQSWILQET